MMTRDEMKALPQGARVVVVSSGKVYQVVYAGRFVGSREENRAKAEAEGRSSWGGTDAPDGWLLPYFKQWRSGEAKYPAGRLYGPAFVSLKPENVLRVGDTDTAESVAQWLADQKLKARQARMAAGWRREAEVLVPGLPRPRPAGMVSDVALHAPRNFDPSRCPCCGDTKPAGQSCGCFDNGCQ
jgi:hypothetical protein